MSLNSSTNDLTEIGDRFLNWKQLYPHKKLPKSFWDDAFSLIAKYTFNDVAKAIGFSPQYLRLKQKKRLSAANPFPLHFVEIEPSQIDSTQIKLHIHGHNGLAVDISFQGNINQIFPLLSYLLKEENPCSK